MKFEKPINSAAHRALLDVIDGQEGLDKDDLRILFWLINAHPNLVSFAQISENLLLVLRQLPFETLDKKYFQWIKYIPAWCKILSWINNNHVFLQSNPALSDLFKLPNINKEHPMDGQGMPRHGMYTALWNRHRSGGGNPTATLLCEQYLCLQAQILIAVMSAIYMHSGIDEQDGLDSYEQYDGQAEFLGEPIQHYQSTLVLRELSLAKYSSMLTAFNPAVGFIAFTKQIKALAKRRPLIPGMQGAISKKYIVSISNYLSKVSKEIWTGELLNKKIVVRRKGGSGGGGKTLHGYVNINEFFFRKKIDPLDIGLESDIGMIEVVCGGDNESEKANIRSGEAPDEDARPIIALYNPDEFKGAMARARHAERIKTTAAQKFVWDENQITDTEIIRLLERLDKLWLAFIGVEKLTAKDELPAQAALLVATMLWLGQSVESARNLYVRNANSAAVAELALLVSTSDDGNQTVYGWRLPALIPNYAKVHLPDDLIPINREIASSFVIPDITGLGSKILTYLQKIGREADRVFSAEPKTAANYFKQVVADIVDGNRITQGRLSRFIGNEIIRQTGDQTMAWCVTGDLTRNSEPRMYYTSYSSDQLVKGYVDIVSVLRSRLNKPVLLPKTLPKNTGNVGARFVVMENVLHSCISKIKLAISNDVFLSQDRVLRIDYHNVFTLYTWLVQSFGSSLRAINDPSEIIMQCEKGAFTASIADKESVYRDRARPVFLCRTLKLQLMHYKKHRQFLINSIGLQNAVMSLAGDASLFFYLDTDMKPMPLTRSWAEENLVKIGYPLPGNFHRAYLRSELLKAKCSSQVIDAFMGHARQGESPFDPYSTFDYKNYSESLEKSLSQLFKNIGLVPMESTLCPH